MGCGASVEGGGATAVAPAMGMGNMTSRTLGQGWSFTALRMLSAKDKPELDAVNELIMTAAMVTQPSTSDGNTRNDLLIGFALLSRRISRPPSGLSCSS